MMTSRKKTMCVWMLSAAALMIVGGAAPARADETIRATVPFDFIVGDAHLPAGDYTVTENTESGFVTFANTDGEHNAIVLTMKAVFDKEATQAELVFDRFEGQLFLARIADEGREGREIILTPKIMEREIQHITVALKP